MLPPKKPTSIRNLQVSSSANLKITEWIPFHLNNDHKCHLLGTREVKGQLKRILAQINLLVSSWCCSVVRCWWLLHHFCCYNMWEEVEVAIWDALQRRMMHVGVHPVCVMMVYKLWCGKSICAHHLQHSNRRQEECHVVVGNYLM